MKKLLHVGVMMLCIAGTASAQVGKKTTGIPVRPTSEQSKQLKAKGIAAKKAGKTNNRFIVPSEAVITQSKN